MSAIVKYDFHGDQLLIVPQGGKLYAAIKPVCEALGVAPQSQLAKLKTKAWAGVTMIVAPDPRGRPQAMAFLELKAFNMWLATIETSKVPVRIRPALERYQVECADVLRDHFMPSQGHGSTGGGNAPAAAHVQARLSDDAAKCSIIRHWVSFAKAATGRTTQNIHGQIRKAWGLNSIYRIPLVAFDRLVADIQSIKPVPRLAAANDKQLKLCG